MSHEFHNNNGFIFMDQQSRKVAKHLQPNQIKISNAESYKRRSKRLNEI